MLNLYLAVLAQFAVSVVLQMVVWRVCRKPDDTVPKQILWLFFLYLGLPLLHFAFRPEWSQLILEWGLGSAYVMSFPAVSARSPTVLILDRLWRQGAMSRAALEQSLLADTNIIEGRMRDLRADGLVQVGAAEFRPSLMGRTLGLVFWTYRRLLCLPLGEG